MTPKRPVVNEYHGTRVTDDYQWLEKGADPEVKAWVAEQNSRARAHLDALPDRKAIHARMTEILTASSPDRFGFIYKAGQLFALKDQPPKQQAFLVVMKSADEPATERVLVDPNAIDPSGKTTIDFYVPSRDGKKIAVSLSSSGTEDGTVHVYDVATGKETGDVVPRVHGGTAGGSLAWNADGTGFYYSRYPSEGERPPADLGFYQQVYFHKLGAPLKDDTYAIGKDFPRIAEADLTTSEDGKYIHASVANGDGGEFDHYLLGPDGKWAKIASIPDKVVGARFGLDNKLYLLSLNGSPRGKIMRLSPDKPDLAKAEVVVPEGNEAIRSFTATKTRLYVNYLAGGPSVIRVFDIKGKALSEVPILPVSSVGNLVRLDGDDILFRNTNYLEPPAWYRYKAKEGKTQKTGIFLTSPVAFTDIEVVREMVTSKDGTKVPINILRKKGTKLDGSSIAMLTGYGGFGISISPGFNATNRLWFDQGGVLAIANLRGGGEFGEDWHRAGNLTKKQNVFDDFAACAAYLVSAGYTRPEKLAIRGGSNGGLLMGAALTQHPEMFKVVLAFVGIFDSVRYELSPNGVFNVPEFGSVKDPEQFKAIYAYSPYHNVKEGTAYPATLFLTGANDPRVDPYHSRKMAARLQAATSSNAPILLRASGDTGHGGGTPLSEEIDEQTDALAFVLNELGVRFVAGSKPSAPTPVAGTK